MSVQGGPATTALIQRVCGTHPERDPEGPLVTVTDGVWAYCAGRGDAPHEWRAIEPMTRQHLESAPQ
jgi:hypothetical protein